MRTTLTETTTDEGLAAILAEKPVMIIEHNSSDTTSLHYMEGEAMPWVLVSNGRNTADIWGYDVFEEAVDDMRYVMITTESHIAGNRVTNMTAYIERVSLEVWRGL